MKEAFVYCWTDKATNKLYVGSHKGSAEDGYICSSKYMLKEYNKRPMDFSRQIIAEGSYPEMRKFETKILKSIDAALNENFYNRHNGDELFYTTKESIKKSIESRKNNEEWFSETTKQKIKQKMLEREKDPNWINRKPEMNKRMSLSKTKDKHPFWGKEGPTKNKVWFRDPLNNKTHLLQPGTEPEGFIRGRK